MIIVPIVQDAWRNGQDLTVQVMGLNPGYVTDLEVNMSSNADLDEVYQLAKRAAFKVALLFIQ
jgi:carbonic anhydrase